MSTRHALRGSGGDPRSGAISRARGARYAPSNLIARLATLIVAAALVGCAGVPVRSPDTTTARSSLPVVVMPQAQQAPQAPPAPQPRPDGPFAVAPTSDVDENLFLVRALEATYQNWPGENDPRDALQQWLARTRVETLRLRAGIAARGLDPDVATLYDDGLRFLDAYEAYLSGLGAIDRNAVRQAQADAVQVVFSSVVQFARAGAVAGILTGLGEGVRTTLSRDETRKAAVEAEFRRVRDAWVSTDARARLFADNLTKRLSWRAGEAGFDGDHTRKLVDNLARRPRDPFVMARHALARDANESPEQAMTRAHALLEAARLVPAGRAYDDYRKAFVSGAAERAVSAAVAQLPELAYSRGPASLAAEALRFCQTLLAVDADDAFGVGHAQLARAWAAARRYDDAASAVTTAAAKAKWRNDMGFSIRAAKIFSLAGRTPEVGAWLQNAYRHGFTDVKSVHDSPDLAAFRQQRPDEYQQLTTPRFTWWIKSDLLLDEVVLRNDSPFELTNVVLDVVVQSGGREIKRELKAKSIQAGKTLEFADVFSIPSADAKRGGAVMRSDQSPRW